MEKDNAQKVAAIGSDYLITLPVSYLYKIHQDMQHFDRRMREIQAQYDRLRLSMQQLTELALLP